MAARKPRTPAKAKAIPPNSKRTPQRREGILTSLRMGGTRSAAAGAVGMSRETFYDWMKADPEFADAVARAEQAAEFEMLARVRKSAVEAEVIETFDAKTGALTRRVTKYDWRAAAWWLERHPNHKAQWAPPPAKVEASGPNGGPIETAGEVVFRPDPAWLAEYAKAMSELPPRQIEGTDRDVEGEA